MSLKIFNSTEFNLGIACGKLQCNIEAGFDIRDIVEFMNKQNHFAPEIDRNEFFERMLLRFLFPMNYSCWVTDKLGKHIKFDYNGKKWVARVDCEKYRIDTYEEHKKNVRKFVYLTNKNNIESCECPVCYNDTPIQNQYKPINCSHIVCRTCKNRMQLCPICRVIYI